MIDKKKYQKLELRVLELEAENRRLTTRMYAEIEMNHERCHEKLRHSVIWIDALIDERDAARSLAASLEAETHACPAEQFHDSYAYREES